MGNGKLMGAVLGSILKVAVAVAAAFIIYRGAVICYDYGYRIFTEPAMTVGEGRTVSVTVTADMSALEIGELMESKGLSRDGKLFALQYLLSEYKEDVKPGTYEVSTSMTAEQIMAAMVPDAQDAPDTPDTPGAQDAPDTPDTPDAQDAQESEEP